MGRTLSNQVTGAPRAARAGQFTEIDLMFTPGTYQFAIPENIDPNIPLRVHCYGAGGSGGTKSSSTGNGYGGGGGGLALSEIPIAALLDAATNRAISYTIGAVAEAHDGIGAISSFGAFLSATGGNSGYNQGANQGISEYGVGGMGVGGDINRRGGRGGAGNLNSSSGYGGGGGSAPAPNGQNNGFRGGNGTSYSGGSGASIHFEGVKARGNHTSAGGSGTARPGASSVNSSSNYSYGGQGGAGLLGAGGRGAIANTYSNNAMSADGAESGDGTAIFEPNKIQLGGGGGGAACYHSSE